MACFRSGSRLLPERFLRPFWHKTGTKTTGLEGPEHSAIPTQERDNGEGDGAECGADGDDSAPIDPDLARVVEAWGDLPPAVRRAIMALIDM